MEIKFESNLWKTDDGRSNTKKREGQYFS